eukprot:1443531-Amphidinium_carterae.1
MVGFELEQTHENWTHLSVTVWGWPLVTMSLVRLMLSIDHVSSVILAKVHMHYVFRCSIAMECCWRVAFQRNPRLCSCSNLLSFLQHNARTGAFERIPSPPCGSNASASVKVGSLYAWLKV